MFDPNGAAAVLFAKNHIKDWAELNPRQTGALLAQTARDNQAANLALAGEALQQMGATDRAQRELDYYKWANKESQKETRRRNSLALLGSLQGVGTAGRRLGISPAQMASVDPNSMLQNLNSLVSGLGQFGNPSADYARYMSQALQYVPGMARSS